VINGTKTLNSVVTEKPSNYQPVPIQDGPDLRIGQAVELAYPGIELNPDVTFGQLWQFLKETNFLYPEKLARLESALPEIETTVSALQTARGGLLETMLIRNAGVICGHLSALRSHARTWTVQHLAARPMSARGIHATMNLNLAIHHYWGKRPDIDWVRIFFRPNNPFPERLYGGCARSIALPEVSDLRQFHYLTASTTTTIASPPGLTVRPAMNDELPLLEDWFTSRGRICELKATDLYGPQKYLGWIGEKFAEAGLLRRRELLVAERRGRTVGFAAIEISSLGMNLSELTNAFTLHMLKNDEEGCVALARGARQRYAACGRRHCIALAEGDTLGALETDGFRGTKAYQCWTVHTSQHPKIERYFLRVFDRNRAERDKCI
jgi:hypothetical protein